MTKIYLVRLNYQLDEKNFHDINGQVFTNKRKAIAYKRYKDAKAKNLMNTEDCWFIGYSSMIDEITIDDFDYTNWAIEEEMKTLPY